MGGRNGSDWGGWEQGLSSATKRIKGRKCGWGVRLRRETTMSLKWIAERLAMGSWTNVSNLLGVERAKTAINFTK